MSPNGDESVPAAEQMELDSDRSDSDDEPDDILVSMVAQAHRSRNPSSSASTTSSLNDQALNSSAILADLIPNTSQTDLSDVMPPPDDSPDVSYAYDMSFEPPSQSLPSPPISPKNLEVEQASTMLELNKAEDELARILKRMLDLGVSQQSLQHHISPSLAEQLFSVTPEPLQASAPRSHSPTTSCSTRQRSVSSPLFSLPPITAAGKKLAPFDAQLKEVRKPSYGTR